MLPDHWRPWSRLLAGACAGVACVMALAVVVDALVLTEGERECLAMRDRGEAIRCLAVVDHARETGSVPGAVLLAILSGAASVLALEDAHRHLP